MGVTVASRLERLVRFVPGVAGYQDREHSRATDKQVRMRLVQEIRRLIQGLDDDKARPRDRPISPPCPVSIGSPAVSSARAGSSSSRAAGTRGSSISTTWTRRRSISSTPSTWDSSMR